MNKFSNKLKNPVFGPSWVHFPNFWGKKIFLENPALSCTTSYGLLAPCQNLEKVKDTIQRKCPDRWRDGEKDRRMGGRTDRSLYRTLLATAGGPKTRSKLRKKPGLLSHRT